MRNNTHEPFDYGAIANKEITRLIARRSTNLMLELYFS